MTNIYANLFYCYISIFAYMLYSSFGLNVLNIKILQLTEMDKSVNTKIIL